MKKIGGSMEQKITSQVNTTDDITRKFAEMQNKSEVAEVLKELFDKKKIEMIGDLSKDEIRLITRISMVAELKEVDVWTKGIQMYTTLMLSKDRKSRREIIDAIRGYSQPLGIMGRMKNMFGGGGM